ncbi:hypothetical protein AUJ83_03800 [Candidatus Woesearchaeota archaeon CG1_02_33_12]|nr:MAG: hypothetical protein AUJ83_03800 [Candidatus Woesearchaeota archaeon CG1_02_33_12]PIN79335.1 MAG: hypothetical protein COV14_00070 [Candidatus Woesearchaeota archaeon CG10_big_fil_rev_8_21_14_0_10_33_12]
MNKKKRKIKKKNLAIFLLAISIIFLVILFNQSGKNFNNGFSFDEASEDYKCPDCNVILITVDALRPDHLGCYGYERNTSPNIDRFAKEEGYLFTQAISQATWTWPSVHSLMTSMYPSTNKVYFFDEFLSTPEIALPYILKKNGYTTAFMSENQGLGALEDSLDGNFNTLKICNGTEVLTNYSLIWIKNNKNKKFFIWLHYMGTHESFLGFPEDKRSGEELNQEEVDYYTLKYDNAISEVDNQFFILIKTLKELNLYNNTIIIISADHGEEMGEHSWYFNHGGPLWDSLIKVPLIFYYPKLSYKSKLIPSQVQLIDIAPTICDILKIKKPETFEGNSFLSLIIEKETHFLYAFSEHWQTIGEFFSSNEVLHSQFSIRSTDWKLIVTIRNNESGYQLYNLKKDPQELNNLADIEKDQFKLMKEKIEEWMSREKENISSLTKPLDEETKEKLRSLGYLQ